MRAQEQAVFVLCLVLAMEGETDRCVLKSGVDIVRVFWPEKKMIGFSAASCLVLMSSQTSVSPHSQGAQTPYHWHCLLAFHCNNHNCYFAFELGAGNISWALRSQRGLLGGLSKMAS